MRKQALVVVVTVAAGVAVLAPSASALKKPRDFTLLEVTRTEQVLRGTPDQPPVAGDQVLDTNDLYRWTGKKGIHVGHDRVLITFMHGFGPTFSHRALALFQAQVYLPDGTIFGEGYGELSPNRITKIEIPVVGGTGVYANARGFVDVRAGRRTLLHFSLMP